MCFTCRCLLSVLHTCAAPVGARGDMDGAPGTQVTDGCECSRSAGNRAQALEERAVFIPAGPSLQPSSESLD